MAKKVKEYIVAEVAPSKYFSVSVESTPYLTHVDQLTTIIRYVVDGKPVERFLTFHRMISHKAEAIATTLLEYLTWKERQSIFNIAVGSPTTMRYCEDVDSGLDNTCEVIRQETVVFSTPETDYIIYD